MKTLTLNRTDRARDAANLIGEHCCQNHRGAMRYAKSDTDKTFCIALFGSEGYELREDSDPVRHSRTKAYVHNLYAGLANLLPEGAVEFGASDDEGYTWVILATFPRHDDHDDFRNEAAYHDEDYDDEDDDCDDENDDMLVDFWNKIVWEQWKSQLAFTEE